MKLIFMLPAVLFLVMLSFTSATELGGDGSAVCAEKAKAVATVVNRQASGVLSDDTMKSIRKDIYNDCMKKQKKKTL
ncbi:MAG: hypothetical protein WBA16_02900 [Nonlabens sp.]